jgi:pimeloyl-ACP methyl ester carboxylesterase
VSHPVLAGAEPFSAAGDRRGALVLHGFTGCPQSVRGLAQSLADAGFTVELPLLPGHGTSVDDMLPTRWEDWSGAAAAAFADLSARCDGVVVAGLSMGGTLALWLAERHPGIAGLVLVNPLVAPPDDSVRALLDAMLAQGETVAPGIGSDIAKEGVAELAVRRGRVGGGRAGGGGLPGARVHERRGPRGRPGLQHDRGGAGRRAGRAGAPRAQLPRGHPGLGQGRDRGPHGGVRRRRAAPHRFVSAPSGGERAPLSSDDVVHVAHLAPSSPPVALENVLRADEPRPSLERDEVLAEAPAVEDHRFRVPRIGSEAP